MNVDKGKVVQESKSEEYGALKGERIEEFCCFWYLGVAFGPSGGMEAQTG